jgi:hypothetical protein
MRSPGHEITNISGGTPSTTRIDTAPRAGKPCYHLSGAALERLARDAEPTSPQYRGQNPGAGSVAVNSLASQLKRPMVYSAHGL